MNQDAIRQKVASFPRWHYQFDLGGVLTPIYRQAWTVRHQERKRYFFDPLVELAGGSLKGKRVLDLGCNAGFWSLSAIEAGADFVLGVDGRQMHVDQSNFVFEVKGIAKSRYEFVVSNFFEIDLATYGMFDVVLCLGILYHVAKPMRLIELIAKANTDLLVIDTGIIRMPGAFLRYRREAMTDPRATMEYEIVSSPTKEALRDMVMNFGYKAVVLKPQFSDYRGSKRYAIGARRAFMCAKRTSLAKLNVPTEDWEEPTVWYHAPVWYGYRLVQAIKRARAAREKTVLGGA